MADEERPDANSQEEETSQSKESSVDREIVSSEDHDSPEDPDSPVKDSIPLIPEAEAIPQDMKPPLGPVPDGEPVEVPEGTGEGEQGVLKTAEEVQQQTSVAFSENQSSTAAGSEQEATTTTTVGVVVPQSSSVSSSAGVEEPPVLDGTHQVFGGLTYLGASAVDAPMSASEANNKMSTFKEHHGQPISVQLAVPQTNVGTMLMLEPEGGQTLAAFGVRSVLLCVRGQELDISDCICINVKNRKSSLFLCHVFLAATEELCEKIFESIGNSFRTKPSDLEILRDGFQLSYVVDVTLEIQEDQDGRGTFTSVAVDKDCFRLKQNAPKQLILSISQPGTASSLAVDKCFGMLVAPGQGALPLNMILLELISMGNSQDRVYTVLASLDPLDPICQQINEETPKGSKAYLTVAADLVLRGIAEPVRFVREVEIRVQRENTSYLTVTSLMHMPFRKKKTSVEKFVLKVEKVTDESGEAAHSYRIGTMISLKEGKLQRQPYAVEPEASAGAAEKKEPAQEEEPVEPDGDIDEEEMLVSGWGDVQKEFSEDLVGQWGSLMERWTGQDKSRPKTLRKLCSKGIPSLLRCQVWQMLTTANYDPQLVDAYRLLITMESPTKDIIDWDIKRTYVAHEFFRVDQGKEALEKISKAYSVYDEEVGYCQGLSFIAAVLLLQKMPEETAFAVLVKIMFDYRHRELFKSGFHALHLSLYQLTRLIEEYMPDLHEHLRQNRVEVHMFATQWFFTLFTAKFALPLVFQFMDIYLCERAPAMFQAALALLKVARKDLLSMDFENILKYFRVTLPRRFLTQADCDAFFRKMSYFKVDDRKLKRLEKDYQAHLEAQAEAEDPLHRLKSENSHLRDVAGRLEHENEYLAQELVGSKVLLREEMDRLEEKIDALSKDGRQQLSQLERANQTVAELQAQLEKRQQESVSSAESLQELRRQHGVTVEEYRSALRQMDEDSITQQNLLKKQLVELQGRLSKDGLGEYPPSSSHGNEEGSGENGVLEQQIKTLELELAQTKLALVEASCHSQQLEHQLSSARPRTSSGSSKRHS